VHVHVHVHGHVHVHVVSVCLVSTCACTCACTCGEHVVSTPSTFIRRIADLPPATYGIRQHVLMTIHPPHRGPSSSHIRDSSATFGIRQHVLMTSGTTRQRPGTLESAARGRSRCPCGDRTRGVSASRGAEPGGARRSRAQQGSRGFDPHKPTRSACRARTRAP